MHQAVKGLNLAEAAGSPSAEARLAAACAVGAGLLARHRLAQAYLRRAFAALEGTDDPSARAGVLQSAALYEVGVGRWPEVREHLEEAAGIVRRLGDPRRLAEIAGLGIWERYFQGELAAVRPLLAELDRIGRQSGDAQVRSWAVAGHAVIGLRTGDLAEASAALRRRPAPAPQALLALLQGDRALAVETLRRALEHAALPPVKCYWFDLYAMSAEVAMALWLDRRGRDGGDTGPWRAMADRGRPLPRPLRPGVPDRPAAGSALPGPAGLDGRAGRPGQAGLAGRPGRRRAPRHALRAGARPRTCWAAMGSRGSARPTGSGRRRCSRSWGSRT